VETVNYQVDCFYVWEILGDVCGVINGGLTCYFLTCSIASM